MLTCEVPQTHGPFRLAECVIHQIQQDYAAKLDQPIEVPPSTARYSFPWRRKRRLKLAQETARVHRIERVLDFGISLYDSVRLVERNWRREILEGTAIYDTREEDLVAGYYRQWSGPCQRCLDEIEHFVSAGMSVQGAEQFQKRCAEAKLILAGDNPFFDDAENAARWAEMTDFMTPKPRFVHVDEDGRIFETNGNRFGMPGLEPQDIRQGLDDERFGRLHSLEDVLASFDQNEV